MNSRYALVFPGKGSLANCQSELPKPVKVTVITSQASKTNNSDLLKVSERT